ncbi:hypothetical protein PoB_005125400 [Plakobranchus ocellatus]|uniref:Uncharacterized protein n=1 Tax=Plakobranchus ocellatus TaxID=259542 RepID=A0AAV4C244_9GAST|nr:hypothetical protein PoB_005125400 [Plakobranchus ocellatus]
MQRQQHNCEVKDSNPAHVHFANRATSFIGLFGEECWKQTMNISSISGLPGEDVDLAAHKSRGRFRAANPVNPRLFVYVTVGCKSRAGAPVNLDVFWLQRWRRLFSVT